MPGHFNEPMDWDELPAPAPGLACKGTAPGEADCVALWDFYGMPDHIRRHSELVAAFAVHVGRFLCERGVCLDLPALYSSALLHDIAKLFCIENGGSHAQIGAAWVVQKTGEPLLGQGVLHHVYWPWQVCFKSWPLPLLIEYADKRVMHDKMVSLNDRFDDLIARYGHSGHAIKFLNKTRRKAEEMERQLTEIYKVDIHAYFTYSWRLV